jgi:hypothetical protein
MELVQETHATGLGFVCRRYTTTVIEKVDKYINK